MAAAKTRKIPEELQGVAKVEDVDDLQERVKALENKFGQNEKFADTFCEAIATQSKIKDTITDHIVKQIKESPIIQAEITKQVNKIDRKAVMVFVKRIGWAGWGTITFVLGVIATIIFTNVLGKH